jgi:hypothetical protein
MNVSTPHGLQDADVDKSHCAAFPTVVHPNNKLSVVIFLVWDAFKEEACAMFVHFSFLAPLMPAFLLLQNHQDLSPHLHRT